MSGINREAIINKVNKLLALSASPNEHEAKLAAERAAKIMQEHQIQDAELLLEEIKQKGGDIVEARFTVPNQKMRYNWLDTMAVAAAMMFDGKVLANVILHQHTVTFVGHTGDIPMMKALFIYFVDSQRSIAEHDLQLVKIIAKRDGQKWEPRDTMRFKQGHGLAFSNTIYRRCKDLTKERQAAVTAASNSGRDLIIVKTDHVTQYLSKKNCRVHNAKVSTGSLIGQAKGRAAGEHIALGGAIKG